MVIQGPSLHRQQSALTMQEASVLWQDFTHELQKYRALFSLKVSADYSQLNEKQQ